MPLTRELKLFLAQHCSGRHPIFVFSFICQTPRRGQRERGQRYPFSQSGWRRPWNRALQAAGVLDFRFHDTRHTAASRVLRTCGNLKVLQHLLGHKDIATTARYAHLNNERDVADALSATDKKYTRRGLYNTCEISRLPRPKQVLHKHGTDGKGTLRGTLAPKKLKSLTIKAFSAMKSFSQSRCATRLRHSPACQNVKGSGGAGNAARKRYPFRIIFSFDPVAAAYSARQAIVAKKSGRRVVVSRRRLLQALGLPMAGIAALAASTAWPRPARAFSLEQAADDVDRLYARAEACAGGANAYHEQLVAEVKAMLAERNANVSDDEIRLAVVQTTCPLCGCRLEA